MTGRLIDGDLIIGPNGPGRIRQAHATIDGKLSKPGQWCVVEYQNGQTALVHSDELALATRERHRPQ